MDNGGNVPSHGGATTAASAVGSWLRSRIGTAAVAATIGLAIGGVGVAVAQTGSAPSSGNGPAVTTPANPAAPATPDQGGDGGGWHRHGSGRFGGGFGGFGGGFGHHGMRGAGGMGMGRMGGDIVHGEATTRNHSGAYQTIAAQSGQVTKVTSSSIEVKSDDGFTRTYGVDLNTLVNAGRDGISSVKTGDTVALRALVSGGKATAESIMDSTSIGHIRQSWARAA